MDSKFWATTFTLTGTIIGAGVLGLPYVFSKSGFSIGLFWLIILGTIMMYTLLCLGEISLRTKGNHHLPGYAKKYLGKKGEIIMTLLLSFGIYSALIAYLIGEGESLSVLFTGAKNYSFHFAITFWLLMTLLLREGLRGLKKIETWGVGFIIILVLIIFTWHFPDINYANYSYNNPSNFFLPFGVVLFAMMGFTSIPELRMEIKGKEEKLKKSIILGILIPIIVYAIFSFIFVGVLGKNVPEIATISFGKLVTTLGIFTMLTSYFVLSFSLKDALTFDFKYSKLWNFILVSILPIIFYLILYFFNYLNFISVLGIGGVIAGGLKGIMVFIINKKSKQKGNRKPEYSMPINWLIIIILSSIFILGIIFEIFIP